MLNTCTKMYPYVSFIQAGFQDVKQPDGVHLRAQFATPTLLYTRQVRLHLIYGFGWDLCQQMHDLLNNEAACTFHAITTFNVF